MKNKERRNPDSNFVLSGRKLAVNENTSKYLTNTEKNITSGNLSGSTALSHRPCTSKSAMLQYNHREKVPTIEDLEHSLSKLKLDLKSLNDNLTECYGKSVFITRDSGDSNQYQPSFYEECEKGIKDEHEEELTYLMQRDDEEAVSHLPPNDSTWYSDPKHLTTSMGEFPMSQRYGISTRSVSPTNRRSGLFGTEMSTKSIDGQLTPVDISASSNTFPVRLTAPHIVGIRSLLPPKFPVKSKNSVGMMSGSPADNRSSKPNPNDDGNRSSSPRPLWIPNSKNANACAEKPPEFRKPKRTKSQIRSRSATAPGYMYNDSFSESLDPPTRHSFFNSHSTKRQLNPFPSESELTFYKSVDEVDTRRALVENSPYQEELARLRMERLRVEEEYLLQLNRESELERIRGPKPAWYAMKGPEFHYECNKNTALRKNKKSWGSILQYRQKLLESSREFAKSV